jgi:predicted acylesterase/phospholipase RssA
MSGSPAEFNRDAVITIQGGGIFGLFLIGQLEYVLQDLEIKPLAYAGTSAGAMLATLSWAGYSPRRIRELLVNKAASKDGIVSLLGPFDPSFHFSELGPLAVRLEKLTARIPDLIKAIEPLKGLDKQYWWQKLNTLSTLRSKLDVNYLKQAFQDGETVLGLANALGCFIGASLEEQMEQWLRDSPLFKDYSIPDGQPRLTFRHARKASERYPLPPLFLAATNLSTRSLELVSSIKDDSDEYDYDDVAIACAVRASAAVPGFFRPAKTRINNSEVSLVDGGWISNYPMWVFSRDLRARLLKMPAHQVLGSKPWVHIGLRLFPKSKSAAKSISTLHEFAGAAFELATGGARSEMDDRASPQDARLRPVWQKAKDAEAVENFLDLTSFDTNLVSRCFTDGREAAQGWLGKMSFALPGAAQIEELLRGLVNFAEEVFRAASPSIDIKARSNVFLPFKDEFRMAYRANMDDRLLDTDHDLSFADTKSGLSGFAFTRRKTMVCNLQKIGELQRSGKLSAEELFGMDKKLGGKVRPDRTWLASVPIFDPSGVVPERWSDGMLEYKGEYYHELPPSIDGPVFGVLNLDAAVPFAEVKLEEDVKSPNHWTNVRVVSIIARMEQVALQLGLRFSKSFGQNAVTAVKSH